MKRLSSALLLLSLCSLAFLTACAAPAPKAPLDSAASRCYDVDSTQSVLPSHFENMFRTVERGEQAFPPCDTTKPAQIRIRPVSSSISGLKGSVVGAGINVTFWALPISLALAFDNIWFLLIPSLQVSPSADILYRIDYPDSLGKVKSESLSVVGNPWFKKTPVSRALLLDQSRREISTRLFGVVYPPKPEPWGRLSLNYSSLFVISSLNGIDVEPRLEKFLPHGIALVLSPGLRIPLEDGHQAYWFYGGPRKYFGKNHSGLFLGVEPVFFTIQEGGWQRLVGAPITFGLVSQRHRISTGISAGFGPGYRWTQGAIGQGYETVGLIDLSVGFRF